MRWSFLLYDCFIGCHFSSVLWSAPFTRRADDMPSLFQTTVRWSFLLYDCFIGCHFSSVLWSAPFTRRADDMPSLFQTTVVS